MPYKLYDYIPNRVLYVRIWGDYSADELVTSNQEVLNYLNRASHKIINISDFMLMRDYPKNVFKLASTFTLFGHPQHNWQIVISPDAAVRFISSTVIQMAKRANNKIQFKVAASPEEALLILPHLDPQLLNLPPFPAVEAYQTRDA